MAVNRKRELHDILERMNGTHRKDMKEVIIGHLNEKYIAPTNQTSDLQNKNKQKWKTSSPQSQSVRLKTPLCKDKLPPIDQDQRLNLMTDTLADFSIGPHKHLQLASQQKPKKNFKSKDLLNDNVLNNNNTILSDTMLPVSPRNKEGKNTAMVHTFHTNPLIYPTKHDQYEQQQQFQQKFLQTNTTTKTKDLKLTHIQDRIEKKLNRLKESQINPSQPSYFKWKIYSDALGEVCDSINTFSPMLNNAKKDCDIYVDKLLDDHTSSHEPMQNKIEMLSGQSTVRIDIKDAQKKVKTLEDRIMKELKENERLRQEKKLLEEHEDSKCDDNSINTTETSLSSNQTSADTVGFDLEKMVEMLHAQIELKLNELEKMRKDQKDNYVPVAVCQQLEHCIKETEVDIQKLCKQNEFLEHNLEELEEELEDVLVKTGIKEKDARLLWRKVDTAKIQDL